MAACRVLSEVEDGVIDLRPSLLIAPPPTPSPRSTSIFVERGLDFDTHGNMVATLARSGSHDYSVGNVQYYDVWGGIRSGSSTEDQGYVANLGHRRDDESGLTYMRARYYEPGTGRFISEDPARNGGNWFSYGENRASNASDPTGEYSVTNPSQYNFWMLVGLSSFSTALILASEPWQVGTSPDIVRERAMRLAAASVLISAAAGAFANAIGATNWSTPTWQFVLQASGWGLTVLAGIVGGLFASGDIAKLGTPAARLGQGVAVFAAFEATILLGLLLQIGNE